MQGTSSLELLVHFNCGACGKWWSVGDAPPDKTLWYCPWCGQMQTVVIGKGPTRPQHEPDS